MQKAPVKFSFVSDILIRNCVEGNRHFSNHNRLYETTRALYYVLGLYTCIRCSVFPRRIWTLISNRVIFLLCRLHGRSHVGAGEGSYLLHRRRHHAVIGASNFGELIFPRMPFAPPPSLPKHSVEASWWNLISGKIYASFLAVVLRWLYRPTENSLCDLTTVVESHVELCAAAAAPPPFCWRRRRRS